MSAVQDQQANSYYKYVNDVIGLLLDPADIIKYPTAKKILTANTNVYNTFTSILTEANAVRMVQVICNCAVILYQYIYPASWFSYFLTTFSGLQKIYHCIFTNPVYGILFYCTFYFKILQGTSDEKKFDQVAEVLGLPKHADAIGTKFLDSVVEIGQKYELPVVDKEQQKVYLRAMASAIASVGGQKTLGVVFNDAIKEVKTGATSIETKAIYNPERDRFDYDDSKIQEQLEFLSRNTKRIKAYMKSQGVNLKKKKKKKRAFLQIAQLKAPDGHVLCLNNCAKRVKTRLECYCESDCGSTTFLGGKKWCWVDKTKCKKGKYLPTMKTPTGTYAYDYCDPENLSTEKCFTGLQYEDCKKQ